MSIKFTTLVLLIAFSINSCADNNNQKIESPSRNASDTLPSEQPQPKDTIKEEKPIEQVRSKPGNITELTFYKGAKSLSVKGHLSKPGDIAVYMLTINKTARLTGHIVVDKGPANIRFNQIVMPDGQSDGPFGQQFEYTLSQNGVYTIKIGANLMAENAFVGDFMLYLTIQ